MTIEHIIIVDKANPKQLQWACFYAVSEVKSIARGVVIRRVKDSFEFFVIKWKNFYNPSYPILWSNEWINDATEWENTSVPGAETKMEISEPDFKAVTAIREEIARFLEEKDEQFIVKEGLEFTAGDKSRSWNWTPNIEEEITSLEEVLEEDISKYLPPE